MAHTQLTDRQPVPDVPLTGLSLFFSTPRFSLDGVPFKEGGSQVTRTEHAKQIKGSPRQTVLRQKLVVENVAELNRITRQGVPNPI